MSKEKLTYTNGNYFCSSELRPDCIKGLSKNRSGETGNLCCLFCDLIEKCQHENKSKTKPCTANIVSPDDYCPYAV
jgi:hypothetical protein